MPSTSKKQHGFMAAVANNPSFAKKVGVPQSVGKDFNEADKGRKFGTGSTRQRINKQDTKHGKIDLPVANLNRMAGMKAGGIMMTKPMKAGGGMPMKDGKPAFLKKMNMGGMAKYAKGGSIRRFEIGGGVSFEDYLKEATKDYSRKGETLEDAAARRNPAPIRGSAEAKAPTRTAPAAPAAPAAPKEDAGSYGYGSTANPPETTPAAPAAPAAPKEDAGSYGYGSTANPPETTPVGRPRAAPKAKPADDTSDAREAGRLARYPAPKDPPSAPARSSASQSDVRKSEEKEESNTGRYVAAGAAGLAALGAAAYAARQGKLQPAIDMVKRFTAKKKEAAQASAAKKNKDAYGTDFGPGAPGGKGASAPAPKVENPSGPFRETRPITPTGGQAKAAMQARNDAALKEAGRAGGTMKGYEGLSTAEKLRLSGGMKKGGPVKRFAKGGTIMKSGGMPMKDGKPAFMQKKMNMGGMAKFAKGGGIESRGKTRGTVIRMAAGGSVSSASSRADGIAQRGRTKFRTY